MPEKAPSFFFPYYTLLKTRPSKDSNFVWVSFSEFGVGDRESSIYTVKVAKNRQGGIMVAFSLPFSSLFSPQCLHPKKVCLLICELARESSNRVRRIYFSVQHSFSIFPEFLDLILANDCFLSEPCVDLYLCGMWIYPPLYRIEQI